MPYLEGDQTEEEIAKNPELVKLLAAVKSCPIAGCELVERTDDGILHKDCTHGHGAFWFVRTNLAVWILEFEFNVDFREVVLKEE